MLCKATENVARANVEYSLQRDAGTVSAAGPNADAR